MKYHILKSNLFFVFLIATFFHHNNIFSQNKNINKGYFKDIEIRIDTNVYTYNLNRIFVEKEWKIPFEHTKSSPIAEIRFLSFQTSNPIQYHLMPSNNYDILDSLKEFVGGELRCKIKFRDLTEPEFINIFLENNEGQLLAIPLYPHTNTYATIYPGNTELFIGEEKSFVIESNFPNNIKTNPIWIEKEEFEYRITKRKEELLLSIIPKKTGNITINLPFELIRPTIINSKLSHQLEEQKFTFNVKGSRLKFLNFDKRDVIWETKEPKGIELQIDNSTSLAINKTYRVEATDETGGPLIAELYTVRRLSNDRVLCMFRPYNYHKSSDGYLYIKDGDSPKFITNINILPKPKISSVSILRRGGTWIDSKQIYPGETVAVRLQGEGLNRTNIRFEDLANISGDTLIVTDRVAHFLLKVPIDIRKKSINIFSENESTGVTLDISEYQSPKELDFVSLDISKKSYVITDIAEPILHVKKIGDISIRFDDFLIDDATNLYGKQYLEIEIRVLDNDNRLIEKQLIDDIIVCPGSNSPRSFSYSNSLNCNKEPISINDYLSNKTYDLKNWQKIELIIKHRKDLYGGQGYTSRVEVTRAKYVTFDVDLSVPAGLIIKKVGEPGFPGLSGISLAMLAQFSFYRKDEIQKLWPFKVGAGFLAKNAFNFSPTAERDLGIVILGSVYPTTKNRKISFPLFFGTGFYLYESKFFFLIGPGVSINF